MYLGCRFYPCVYVEFSRIPLEKSGLHIFPCTINCQTRVEAGVLNQRGSSWQFLSSAVLTAFTFEAYLNHVGPQVIACWASLERLPPQAKFELLCETLKVEFPEGRGKRPLQTIDRLFEFRNNMAHGRSETL